MNNFVEKPNITNSSKVAVTLKAGSASDFLGTTEQDLNYCRGELPKGQIQATRKIRVGNEHNGFDAWEAIVSCEDGLWVCFPQDTGPDDYASHRLMETSQDFVLKKAAELGFLLTQ